MKKITTEELVERASAVHRNRFGYSKEGYLSVMLNKTARAQYRFYCRGKV